MAPRRCDIGSMEDMLLAYFCADLVGFGLGMKC